MTKQCASPILKIKIGKKQSKGNATFNSFSFISWRSVLLAEETGVPGENHCRKSLTKPYHIMLYRVHLA